jgi:hypothetical protein
LHQGKIYRQKFLPDRIGSVSFIPGQDLKSGIPLCQPDALLQLIDVLKMLIKILPGDFGGIGELINPVWGPVSFFQVIKIFFQYLMLFQLIALYLNV